MLSIEDNTADSLCFHKNALKSDFVNESILSFFSVKKKILIKKCFSYLINLLKKIELTFKYL